MHFGRRREWKLGYELPLSALDIVGVLFKLHPRGSETSPTSMYFSVIWGFGFGEQRYGAGCVSGRDTSITIDFE